MNLWSNSLIKINSSFPSSHTDIHPTNLQKGERLKKKRKKKTTTTNRTNTNKNPPKNHYRHTSSRRAFKSGCEAGKGGNRVNPEPGLPHRFPLSCTRQHRSPVQVGRSQTPQHPRRLPPSPADRGGSAEKGLLWLSKGARCQPAPALGSCGVALREGGQGRGRGGVGGAPAKAPP